MWDRVLTVFRAGFAARWGAGSWPVAPLVVHATVSAVLCGLAGDSLPPFAYGIFALSVSGALIALPLLGDFAELLRSDPASEWVEALPVSRGELRLARTLLILLTVAVLSLAGLLPAAFFAPDAAGWVGRLALLAGGLAQALFLAALLVGLQSALGGRAESLLVLLQTLLFTGVVLGLVFGLRLVPAIADLDSPSEGGAGLALYPPAWFASILAPGSETPVWPWRALFAAATAAALVVLALAPLPKAPPARASGGFVAFLLRPLRALATRTWVRAEERASFDLVFDALPREREFVLRTYPLAGVALAFLIAGSSDILAVLLFVPAAYLPILLVQVQGSASHEARWILDTAPVSARAIAGGAVKAVALRFLVPLYLVLFLLAGSIEGISYAVRIGLPAALLTMILLRKLYDAFVREPPLSVPPDAIEGNLDWTGPIAGLGIGLTLAGILAARLVTSLAVGLALAIVLLAVERTLDRRAARGTRHRQPA